jgi:septal ring factor EnvC (AmiA/AmiB activator)
MKESKVLYNKSAMPKKESTIVEKLQKQIEGLKKELKETKAAWHEDFESNERLQKEINELKPIKDENEHQKNKIKVMEGNIDNLVQLTSELKNEIVASAVPKEDMLFADFVIDMLVQRKHPSQLLVVKKINSHFLKMVKARIAALKESLGGYLKTEELASLEFEKLSKGEVFIP